MTENTTQAAECLSRLTAELGDLRGKLKVLEMEMSELRKQAKEKELAICKINYGVYIGCVVRSKEGVNYKIAVIEPYFKSKPSMKGYKQKKDGSYGNVANYIYDGWVLVA